MTLKKHIRGLSLVELLVALTIGSLLIAGAVYVYSQSRRTNAVNDTIARLQENARYVFSVLEPDIQLAGYYGFSNYPDDFKFITAGSTASALPASKMEKDDPAVPGLVASAQACGNNFAVDLIATIEGSNGYSLPCAALGGGAQPGTDTLTIRRASVNSNETPAPNTVVPTPGRLQLVVSRLSPTNQFVIADGILPAEPPLEPNLVQVRDLVVRTYYIAKNSTEPAEAGLPSLRVKQLGNGPGFPATDDVEIMRGVEDLQVQFGIDTGDYDGDGIIDPGHDEDKNGVPDAPLGIATRYVNPDQLATMPGFQVVAVRIWVLMRAERPELGFVNNTHYQYADHDYPVNDSYRRVLMSRTIQLRNSRTL